MLANYKVMFYSYHTDNLIEVRIMSNIHPALLPKLKEWEEAKAHANYYKDLEAKLRDEVVAIAYPERKPLTSGTDNIDLPNGWILKTVFKTNVTIDEAAVGSTIQELTKKGFSPDKVFGVKHTYIDKGFKKLPIDARAIAGEVLTFKDGTPQVSLIPPKLAKA